MKHSHKAPKAPSRTRAMLAAVAIALACLSGVACGGRAAQGGAHMQDGVSIGPGPMQVLADDAASFFSEQSVALRWGAQTHRFRAVLQRRGAQLELILLDPMGRPGFRLYQQGDEVGIENFSDRTLPFEAAYMLADVQKVFLVWPLEDAASEARVDAAGRALRTGEFDGLRIEEVRADGALVERRFWRADMDGDAPLTVAYRGGTESLPFREVELVNAWFQYTLSIEILTWETLEAP